MQKQGGEDTSLGAMSQEKRKVVEKNGWKTPRLFFDNIRTHEASPLEMSGFLLFG